MVDVDYMLQDKINELRAELGYGDHRLFVWQLGFKMSHDISWLGRVSLRLRHVGKLGV